MLLGQGMRDQLALAPVHQVTARLLGRVGVRVGGGRNQRLGAQAQGTCHGRVVLLDRLGGVGVGLARGDDEFGHVRSPSLGWFGRFASDFITLCSVENNRPSMPLRAAPGYGPRPGAGRARAPLSRSRAALLETLRAQSEPTTLAALVAISGLHANTVREHLDALVRQGLAHRHAPEPAGRGRPAWLYEATGSDAAAAPEYAGLAAALAAAIHRTSTSPSRDAVAAGREWGHELARDRGAGPGRRVRSRPGGRWSPCSTRSGSRRRPTPAARSCG